MTIFYRLDSELISNYLNRNKPALETMLAEVRSQSADDLVDGITSAEERRYSYNHYYGSRFDQISLCRSNSSRFTVYIIVSYHIIYRLVLFLLQETR